MFLALIALRRLLQSDVFSVVHGAALFSVFPVELTSSVAAVVARRELGPSAESSLANLPFLLVPSRSWLSEESVRHDLRPPPNSSI